MNTEEKANSLEPEDIPSGTGSKLRRRSYQRVALKIQTLPPQ